MNVDEQLYSIWKVAERRFAITRGRFKAVPILGYVFRYADISWGLEYRGKMIEVFFVSLDDAAHMLLALHESVN